MLRRGRPAGDQGQGGQGGQGDEGEPRRRTRRADERADAGADRGRGEELPRVLHAQGPAGPARAGRLSATDVNARPLSATEIVVARTSTTPVSSGTRVAPLRASTSRASTPATATQRRTRTRLPTRSLSAPTAMRPTAPTNCAAPTRTRDRRVPPQADGQPDEPERRQRELRDDQQQRDGVDAPEEPVAAVGVRGRGRLRAGRPGRVPHAQGAGDGEDEQPGTGQQERRAGAVVRGERGDDDGGHGHPEGLGDLPDAHRQPAPACREPAHDDPPLAALVLAEAAPPRASSTPSRTRSSTGAATRATHRRQAQAAGDDPAFTEPVGQRTPGDERQDHPERRGGGQRPGPGQRQSVALVQERDEVHRRAHTRKVPAACAATPRPSIRHAARGTATSVL